MHPDTKVFGLAGYYRWFLPNFRKITKPSTELLRKNTPYVWDDKTEKVSNTMKESLIHEP
jgi:hypothetical protein